MARSSIDTDCEARQAGALSLAAFLFLIRHAGPNVRSPLVNVLRGVARALQLTGIALFAGRSLARAPSDAGAIAQRVLSRRNRLIRVRKLRESAARLVASGRFRRK